MKTLIPLVMLILTACNEPTIEEIQSKQYDHLKGSWTGYRYNLTPIQTKEIATLAFDGQVMTINKNQEHRYNLTHQPDLNNFYFIKSDTIMLMINEMSASTLIATDMSVLLNAIVLISTICYQLIRCAY